MGEKTYYKRNENWKLLIQYILIMALSSYVALDLSFHYGIGIGTKTQCNCATRDVRLEEERDPCLSREAHFSGQAEEERAWKQMKWIGEAAVCKVKGHLIEKLDHVNNFRRGFALKFTADVEDKVHLLPWLLAAKTGELGARKRRVYLDLGANNFNTSVSWFLRMYPCDFTEVHAFEPFPWLWRAPATVFHEDANLLPGQRSNAIRVNSTPSVSEWMMELVKTHFQPVSDRDDPSTKSINITRFIKEELRLTPDDTVVVKMDIEGAEWPVLRNWMEDPEMPLIVDELFVEVHYSHPNMRASGWDVFAPHTRDEAWRLLADLRWRGFYAHFWT